MREVVERKLFKITDDLIIKRGYVERVVDEEGEVDWLMNGRFISDEHVKELLEKRLYSIKKKKTDEYVEREQSRKETLLQEIERIKKILKRDFGIEFE